MQVDLLYYSPQTTEAIDMIASQSRRENPEVVEGLFEKTIDWGHDSIQEFADYCFHLKGVSRITLAQLTRHRMASYNVQSGRHTEPKNMVIPTDDEVLAYKIEDFISGVKEKAIQEFGSVLSTEDLRYLFPQAFAVNMFVKFNGRSIRNFFTLRLSRHAQWEIRMIAKKIYDLVKEVHPRMVYKLKVDGEPYEG